MRNEVQQYCQNREMSWLSFNERVLEEAEDTTVPLLERMKFVSIFTSNLDEFFMIRVGSIFDMHAMGDDTQDKRTGMTPLEQLRRIYATMPRLYHRRNEIYSKLREELKAYGVARMEYEELSDKEKEYLKTYFMEQVLPMLSPQIVDSNHPFPHLQNKEIYVVADLQRKSNTRMGIVPVPSALPPLVFFPSGDLRYVTMERTILAHMDLIFAQYTVSNTNYIAVTRNADISPDDESFDNDGDFRYHMRKVLTRRRKMAVVRMEIRYDLSNLQKEILMKECTVTGDQIFRTIAPIKMGYIFSLMGKVPAEQKSALLYPPFAPQQPIGTGNKNILSLVKQQDLMFHFPYDTMDPFLQMVREASTNPDVVSIKITIYRLASKARLVEYLCAAAENGKEVVVLIELRARFDEQNNIDWSERLEEAGCRILYGFEGYKVHSKVCLITKRGANGPEYITQIGTGNYNENTAKLYTDLSLITANTDIGQDASNFFMNMATGSLTGEYHHLLVAPNHMKSVLMEHIQGEIAKGDNGKIVIKCNSITDTQLIEALSKASRAGVKVDLIVRGICCLLPGVPAFTDKITVTSLVGQYLEHTRIYSFGKDEDTKYFIGSADMMSRNTERRVEVLIPIYDNNLKAQAQHIIDMQLADTTKSRLLMPDGRYVPKTEGTPGLCAQNYFMEAAIRKAGSIHLKTETPKQAPAPQKKKSFLQKLAGLFRN